MTTYKEEKDWLNSYIDYILDESVPDFERYKYVVKAYGHAERALVLAMQLNEMSLNRLELLHKIRQSLQTILFKIIQEKWKYREIVTYLQDAKIDEYILFRQREAKDRKDNFDASK